MGDNRRVRMTKRMLKEALLELLEHKPLEKVTVTQVCARADVNRSTFYAYYESVEQLLREIEDEVLEDFPVLPETEVGDADARFLEVLEHFFDQVKEQQRLFRVLFIQRESSSRRLINAVMEQYVSAPRSEDGVLKRYAYTYCVNGVTGILREWICGDFPVSAGEVAKIVLHMSARAMA